MKEISLAETFKAATDIIYDRLSMIEDRARGEVQQNLPRARHALNVGYQALGSIRSLSNSNRPLFGWGAVAVVGAALGLFLMRRKS